MALESAYRYHAATGWTRRAVLEFELAFQFTLPRRRGRRSLHQPLSRPMELRSCRSF
jgi:hypothetical protein